MTEDLNTNDQTESVTSSKVGQAEDPATREEWEAVHSNPDPSTDLGYSACGWEEFDTLDNTDQVMFLPAEKSVLEEETFVVAESDALRDLGEFC